MTLAPLPKRKLHLAVRTLNKNWRHAVPQLRQHIRKVLAKNCLGFCPPSFQTLALSIILTNNSHVQQLNQQYRHHNKPTNVLSFCLPQQYQDQDGELVHFLGDVFLSYETIMAEAVEQDKTFKDHFTHLLIHGFLHLLGYDHQNKNEAKIMEKLEIGALASLHIANPYITSFPNR